MMNISVIYMAGLVVVFYAAASLGIAGDNSAIDKYDTCPLSASIALKYKSEIREGKLDNIVKQQKTEKLIEDLRVYANNFRKWSETPLDHMNRADNSPGSSVLSPEEIRKQKVEQFKKEWYQGTEPVQRNGSIVVAEIKELARRRVVKAAVYLQSIAESNLPLGLDKPTSAMIKHNYQNPAAEAWLTLIMPAELSDDQDKNWIAYFIKEEAGQGKSAKKWAIEAAERMIRKIDMSQRSVPLPPSPL